MFLKHRLYQQVAIWAHWFSAPFRWSIGRLLRYPIVPYVFFPFIDYRINVNGGENDPERDRRFFTIEPGNFSEDTPLIQHMFVFMGNAQRIDDRLIADYKALSQKRGLRITLVENPGCLMDIHYPIPTCFSDIVDNAEAVVNEVKEKYSLKNNNILLYGHSLGGAVATLLATRLFLNKDDCPYLLADRTFSSLSKVVASVPLSFLRRFFQLLNGAIFGALGLIFPLISSWLFRISTKILDAIFESAVILGGLLLKPILWLCGWEAEVGLHYALLPEEKKHYLFVRAKKDDLRQNHLDDGVISLAASLDHSPFLKIPYLFDKYFLKMRVFLGIKNRSDYEDFKFHRKKQKISSKDIIYGEFPFASSEIFPAVIGSLFMGGVMHGGNFFSKECFSLGLFYNRFFDRDDNCSEPDSYKVLACAQDCTLFSKPKC